MDEEAPLADRAEAVAWWREPTRPQWITFLAAWAGWVLDAFDFTIFLLAMPDIARTFGVSSVATASSITLTLVVRLAGGLCAGWAADRFGRRLPLVVSIVWFALCDGAVAFAPTFGWVLVLRTLFGFGMGAEWTAGATLAMESWPERSRGIASGILQGSWAVGYILAALGYAWIAPRFGWQALFLAAALPALLALPIRLWVPESREWSADAPGRAGVTLADLRSEKVILRVAWASVLWGATFAVYYGLTGMWSTLLRQELGLAPREVAWLAIAFNLGMLAGAIGWGRMVSRRGALWALGLPLALLVPALPLHVGAWTAGGAFVGSIPNGLWPGAFLAGAFGAGTCGVTPLVLTSLFPARVRAVSVGAVYQMAALLAAPTPALVAWLHDRQGVSWPIAMGSVVGAAALLSLAILLVRPAGALPESALRGTMPGVAPAREAAG